MELFKFTMFIGGSGRYV